MFLLSDVIFLDIW